MAKQAQTKAPASAAAKRATRRLLCLGATSDLSPENEPEMATILDGPVDWDYLLQMAEFHGISPLLADNLNRESLSALIPPPYAERLHQLYQNNLYRSVFLAEEMRKILDVLKQEGIAAIVLKGTVLAEQLYVNPALRTTTDIDLLIEKKALPRAAALIQNLGYDESTLWEEQQHPFHRVYYKQGQSPIIVELHWDLDDPTIVPSDMAEIRRRARPFVTQDYEVLVLSPEDTLLYLTKNVLTQDGQQLKYLGDITRLLKINADSLDWDYIIASARATGTAAVAYYSLKWAQELLDAPMPAEIITALRPPALRRWLVGCLIDRRAILTPVGGAKLRSEITALARGLMMARWRQRLAVLTRYRGHWKRVVTLRCVLWVPLVLTAALVLKFSRLYRNKR